MAKKSKGKGGARTGMTSGEHGVMSAPGSPGQDGFNITSAVTTYEEGPCSYPEIGQDNVDAMDPRARGGKA